MGLKITHVFGYPVKLTIDPVNFCNLRCMLCPTGTQALGRDRAFMDFRTFKKIIDECGEYLWAIDLFNWGEPLLNENIFDMIEYARMKRIDVDISTNLNKFSDEICIKLIRSKLNSLIISLDGASQESIDKYQKGNNFELVIENIRKLVKTKEELNSQTPFIQWRFLVNRFNEHEIENARRLAKELKINNLEIGSYRCDMAGELFLNNEAQFDSIRPWLPVNEELSMYNYAKKQKKKVKKACKLLWNSSAIQPDGSVAPCCVVWYEKYDFGNINKTSFSNIWNGIKYKNARRIMKGHNIQDSEHICYICKSNKAMI